MDKMGKKGRVHEAHSTASMGKRCEGSHLPLQLQLSNKILHCQINSDLKKIGVSLLLPPFEENKRDKSFLSFSPAPVSHTGTDLGGGVQV